MEEDSGREMTLAGKQKCRHTFLYVWGNLMAFHIIVIVDVPLAIKSIVYCPSPALSSICWHEFYDANSFVIMLD